MLEQYPQEVKLVHKFVPAHDFTMKAATAALAADEQGKFREFHAKLFEYQSVLDGAKISDIATRLKLNMERFRKKMKDPALEALVTRDYDEAIKLGVAATPWIYINGIHLKDHSLPGFKSAIDRELQKQ